MTYPLPPHTTTGWQAALDLKFTARDDRTVLAERSRKGPLAVQRPFYPEDGVCHVYVLHPPGGVVGGDQLTLSVQSTPNSHALLTTPGATKFYRSAGQQATQQQHFTVSGTLEWLPQESIFFPGAQSQLRTRIDLTDSACYLGWEIYSLGRPVINEVFEHGELRFSTQLFRNQQPVFIDRLLICGKEDLFGFAGLRGQPVVATLLATPASPQLLEMVQPLCEQNLVRGYAGVTLLNDVLVLRYLGECTAEAQQLLRHVWQTIRPIITGHQAIFPRIWNT